MNSLLDRLVALIKRFEGCRLEAYPDPGTGGAPWTIGYGETWRVKQGDVWTQEQADKRLRERAAGYLLAVYKRCPQLHLEPPERVIACVSLAYNIGTGAFGASSVCRYTRRREYAIAADRFLLWRFAAGREMAGLKRRRQQERALYLSARA